MKPNRLAINYAKALLTVSKDLDCIVKTGESLQMVHQLMQQEKVFRAFVYTTKIDSIEKVNILKKVTGASINPVVQEFLVLLGEQNNYHLIAPITKTYSKLQKESLNQVDVIAFSSETIDDETLKSIVKGIEKSSEKTINLSTQTDSDLLGGIKLRIGNTIFDATIANQMAKMKKKLLQNY